MSHQYFKDWQWYGAFILAIIVWLVIHFSIQPAILHNLLESPQLILFSIILYPLLEEIVFRGMLQGQMLRRTRLRVSYIGITRANILTSIVFSGLHAIYQPPMMALLIFFPSVVFGYFRDRHKTIVPSIFLHSFYNLGFLLFFSF